MCTHGCTKFVFFFSTGTKVKSRSKVVLTYAGLLSGSGFLPAFCVKRCRSTIMRLEKCFGAQLNAEKAAGRPVRLVRSANAPQRLEEKRSPLRGAFLPKLPSYYARSAALNLLDSECEAASRHYAGTSRVPSAHWSELYRGTSSLILSIFVYGIPSP
jgi:hypothetical protein